MYIVAFYTDNGVPKTGLTPTVKVRRVVDLVLVVPGENMTEIGDGWYKYNYAGYDSTIDYVILCDGGAGLVDEERYVFAGNDAYVNDIRDGILDDSTRFSGADIDGAISDIPDAVEAVQLAAHGSGSWITADLTTIQATIGIIEKLTGHKVTMDGTIATIYETDGHTPWRQYDLENDGRVPV